MTHSKKHLAEILSAHFPISKTQAHEMLSVLFDAIDVYVLADDRVVISNFGSFSLKHRAGRTVTNDHGTYEVLGRDYVHFHHFKKRK